MNLLALEERLQLGVVGQLQLGAGQVALRDLCFGVQALGLQVKGQGGELHRPQIDIDAEDVVGDDGCRDGLR